MTIEGQLEDIQDELEDIKNAILVLGKLLNAPLQYQCEECKHWYSLEDDNRIPAHQIDQNRYGFIEHETQCEGTRDPSYLKARIQT